MPLIKRKPVLLTPLPPLSAVLQPLLLPSSILHPPQPASPVASTINGKSKKITAAPPVDSFAEANLELPPLPPDGKDDEEQLERLQSALRGDLVPGITGAGVPTAGKKVGGKGFNAAAAGAAGGVVGVVGGSVPAATAAAVNSYKAKNVDCFYIPETGEVFLDYESYAARRAFYTQPIFQCEVSSKSSLTFFKAQQSENKEARQLHTRFPRQLKKAVLSAVQFQIEGKLDNLADKVYERFVNRFFDDEKVFVDVQGDKYLARIVKTFLPRSLQSANSTPVRPQHAYSNGSNSIISNGGDNTSGNITYHPLATDLSMSNEEVLEKDDPMKYFYNVRLIEEGTGKEGLITDYASLNGGSNSGTAAGDDGEGDEGKGERWGSSTMEVQADKISRDRINFSRAMLKRFIKDCVTRDSAVYSPWFVKPTIAARYSIPTEMPESVRLGHIAFRERQMDKRKREREERLGINTGGSEMDVDVGEKEDELAAAEGGKGGKKNKKVKREEVEEVKKEEMEFKRRKPTKYPAEDLLVEFAPDRDPAAGRIEVRPAPEKSLPFQDKFEHFLMAWSFLNVMGKPLGLSPFTLDDFEQSLYHNDPYTSPSTLLTEIHATLLNALISDTATHEPPKSQADLYNFVDTGVGSWEGKKGANIDTLRPYAEPLAASWLTKELSIKDSRKGWESSLVGCLWAKAKLETLPSYLDNILHLLFEDKPAPTRPTWSTGPTNSIGGASGLIPSKPEKRYSSLHFLHKLDIVCWLVELAAQTAGIREFMEESVAALTEVRKDQVEVKREWKRVRAEREALEPKEKPGGEAIDADGDVSMDVKPDLATPEPTFTNGVIPGTATNSNTERDELESTSGDGGHSHIINGNHDDLDSEMIGSPSPSQSEDNVPSHIASAAERRRAMAEKALERSQAESERNLKAQREREEAKARKASSKSLQAEKRRLEEEEQVLSHRLRMLDHDFRSHIYTLRARPLGYDRFGNKVWWMDGLGSSSLIGDKGGVVYGTGRLYLQGAEEGEVEWNRLSGIGAATAAAGGNRNVVVDISEEEVEERRKLEEGEGRLASGQWGMYDSPDQLAAFVSWLNPKGIRELHLLKQITMWYPELEGGMKKRRTAAGLDIPPESDEPTRRVRPTRKAAGGEDEKDGFLNWKNRRALGKE